MPTIRIVEIKRSDRKKIRSIFATYHAARMFDYFADGGFPITKDKARSLFFEFPGATMYQKPDEGTVTVDLTPEEFVILYKTPADLYRQDRRGKGER